MIKSESISNLAKALTTFQIKVGSIKKDSVNPFFKSKYASLTTIIEHITIPLAESGLCYTQFPDDAGLTTVLMHSESGEYIQATYVMPVAKQNDPQALGSAITYARRYAIGSILGLAIDEDDDANAATKQPEPTQQQQVDDNRKWLNQFSNKEMTAETIDWTNAVQKLKSGIVKMKNIEAVYKMSKETKLALEKATK